jgi:transposase
MSSIISSPGLGEGSYVDVLGIDISKADFHCCLMQGERNSARSFPNNPSGYRQLQSWLRNRRSVDVHACMEATGAYWLGVAKALYENGATVSVVNPASTVHFARSLLQRTKTDQVDAAMLARFCRERRPEAWQPPAPETLEIRALENYRKELIDERVRRKQIIEDVPVGAHLRAMHERHLQALDEAIEQTEAEMRRVVKADSLMTAQVAALEAIKGIGFLSAVAIVAKLPVERLRNGKAAAAYAGLAPAERQSGTSVHGKPRICKTGNAKLRRDLYMPALSASRHNPILKAFAERLSERGKPNKVILAAVMRKLVVLAYRLLKDLTLEKSAATA